MSAQALEVYRALTAEMLAARARSPTGEISDADEDAFTDRLDAIWLGLSDDERRAIGAGPPADPPAVRS